MKRPDFRRRKKRNAFPKMMERIGCVPKLWDAERRAEKYALLAHVSAYFQESGKAKRHERAAQHGKLPASSVEDNSPQEMAE